jgi:hypothetical protein
VVLPQGGFNYIDQTDLINYFNRISVEWSKTFNTVHEVNVLAGEEIRFTNRSANSSTGMGVVFESGGVVVTDPSIIEFFNLQNIDYFSISEEKDRFFGLFLNAGYAYKSRYVGNFTVRYDGSNQLGESDAARYLPTWNVSGAWNMHNEGFFQDVGFFQYFDYMKLRGTYGISGNLPPDASALLNLQADVTVRPTDVEPFLQIVDLTNTELTWEKLKEFNVGIDFGLKSQALNASFDFYIRDGFDLIGVVQTSGIGGQGLKVGNFADMESIGFEAQLSSHVMEKGEFDWNLDFNIGYNRDEITRLDFGPRIADAIGQTGAAVLGGPRRGIFSTKFAGLDEQGIPEFFDENGERVYSYDLQERNGLLSTLNYEGPAEPRVFGGLNNVFSYKDFSLSALISYKWDYAIRLNDSFFATYTDFDALPGELADRWAVPGDEALTNVPVILDRGVAQQSGDIVQAYDLYNKSELRIARGDYVRLKAVRLSYFVPPTFTRKIGLNTATLSLEGQNLALLYSDAELNGQDPEFFRSGGVSLPQPRQITFSLNIGF